MEGAGLKQQKRRVGVGHRGGSFRPGLLPARTRHDVRRGRGRPPQPVGGGCQGPAAGGTLRGEPSGEVVFLGVPPELSFTEALLELAKEFGQRAGRRMAATVLPSPLLAPPRPLARRPPPTLLINFGDPAAPERSPSPPSPPRPGHPGSQSVGRGGESVHLRALLGAERAVWKRSIGPSLFLSPKSALEFVMPGSCCRLPWACALLVAGGQTWKQQKQNQKKTNGHRIRLKA